MADIEIIEHRVNVGDLTFNVAEAGTGSPVILLHGWPDSWHLWRDQIESLAKSGHRVIAPVQFILLQIFFTIVKLSLVPLCHHSVTFDYYF